MSRTRGVRMQAKPSHITYKTFVQSNQITYIPIQIDLNG